MEESEAQQDEHTGQDVSDAHTLPNEGHNQRKLKMQVPVTDSKSVKPKMFVRRIQDKPSTRTFGTQTLVLKRTTGIQYKQQTLQDTVKAAEIQEEHEDSDVFTGVIK